MVNNGFEGVNTFQGLLATANTYTAGFGWFGLLIMMHLILLIAMLPFGIFPAILSAAFISLIAGLFLTYLNLVGWSWLMFFLGEILLVMIYITWMEK